MKFFLRLTVMVGVTVSWQAQPGAKVHYSRQGALQLAFPGADEVAKKHIFLSAKQLQNITARCRCKQKSKLLTVYVGKKKGRTVGYAYIDTHLVRTLPETFMMVVDLQGRIKAVHILAFHEPPEYQPPRRWLAQFSGINSQSSRRVAAVAGATLSAHAINRATRRLLAVHHAIGLKP